MSTFYIRGDGTLSADRADRIQVAPADVAAAWLRQTREIPPQFAIGTGDHESGFSTNERYYDSGSSGHSTDGIFQLDAGDLAATLMLEKSPLDLDDACAIFASRCSKYKSAIQAAVDDYNASNGLQAIDWSAPPSDLWAYIAIAHNQGLGVYRAYDSDGNLQKGALGAIARNGMDWASYKARNPTVAIAMDRGSGIYGDDVISGGASWDPSFAAPADDQASAPVVDAATSTTLRTILVALIALLLFVRFV